MADIPIYVAVITAAAGIIGAAIPQISFIVRDVRQAERDRLERHAAATRHACLELLRAVGELRAQVADNHEYHGEKMGARLAKVRKRAAAAEMHAVSVGLLVPATLAGPAERLAAAASRLAAVAAENTDLALGVMARAPNFTDLDACLATFRQIAVAQAKS